MMKKILIFIGLLLFHSAVWAAVGCDLNDPDRDVKRFFPACSGYKTDYLSVAKIGGEELYRKLEEKLGDQLSGIYETINVPYTVYTILNKEDVIGYIHGVNQKGKYGGMQVFLILDKNGIIQNFYFQKLTSRRAEALRSHAFAEQFLGLKLADFDDYDVVTHASKPGSKVAMLQNPAPEAADDFYAALRGVKKNLILMDYFVFNRVGEK